MHVFKVQLTSQAVLCKKKVQMKMGFEPHDRVLIQKLQFTPNNPYLGVGLNPKICKQNYYKLPILHGPDRSLKFSATQKLKMVRDLQKIIVISASSKMYAAC